MGLVGATADDTEAELIRGICEKELLDGKQYCCVPFSLIHPDTSAPTRSPSSNRQSGASCLCSAAA